MPRLIFLNIILICILEGCCHPNECRPAVLGFDRFKPVIQALENYYKKYEAYPRSLNLLTPEFVENLPSGNSIKGFRNYTYTGAIARYELKFSYGGPGYNLCTYDSVDQDWRCGRLY